MILRWLHVFYGILRRILHHSNVYSSVPHVNMGVTPESWHTVCLNIENYCKCLCLGAQKLLIYLQSQVLNICFCQKEQKVTQNQDQKASDLSIRRSHHHHLDQKISLRINIQMACDAMSSLLFATLHNCRASVIALS